MTDKIENGHDQTTDVRHVLSGIDELKEVNIISKENKEKEIEALANNPVVQSLAKAHKAMAEKKILPIRTDSLDLSQRITEYVNELPEDELYEQLKILLTKPHFTSLLKCQDDVGIKNKTNIEQLHGTNTDTNGNHKFDGLERKTKIPRAIRMVGLYKKSWEPLGLTVAKEGNELKIARILHGSEIEKKGLLHVDDIIMEVNGNSLGGDPKKLQEYLLKTSGLVVFKILPSYEENLPPKLLYIKCHINYDPKEDDQSPCAEAGLSFKKGDILQVVDQKDSDWWQAQRVNNKGEARGRAGLIPSLSFEEKRRALKEIKMNTLTEKKKSRKLKSKRTMYNASQNAAFDKHDIAVYEEVACIPPFSRKMLVLLIQSRTVADGITQTIIDSNPEVYGKSEKTIEPPTTNGSSSSTTLHSEQSESFYNPQLTAAREILKEGKTCVMTATPQCLKLLRTSEFMPFVVFLKSNEDLESPPEENIFNHSNEDIERHYSRYIDTTLDMAPTNQLSEEIIEKLGQLKTKHQWVPTSWVY